MAGKATHLIPSTSRDLGRLRRLIATDIDLVQSSRSAITVSCASPAHLSRPLDRCRVLPWKISVKVERPQRSEDERP